ncbi:MAG: imidazole glycerol phosphate synthase subunit HisF [Flavisolibacter sp.]|nr:imidazole glycerol phosphate synthase subunit HisF [Flavisolibacter sp.]
MRIRIIPCLQLAGSRLVKTRQFKIHQYIGDPVNTVKIFNELEADELCFLDITATTEKRTPELKLLRQIADECFMPLSYGGGISDFETARKLFSIGFEKIVINTAAIKNPGLIRKLAEHYGSQAVVVSIDIKKNLLGRYEVRTENGREKVNQQPVAWAQKAEQLGAGEILLTSIDKEGTWSGYDITLTKKIAESVGIPVIANGGAGSVQDIIEVIQKGSASAVALSSMLLFQKKGMGVLINYPLAVIRKALTEMCQQ